MSGEKIVTDFGGFIKVADCGNEIYLDPNTNINIIENMIQDEECERTA